MLDNISHVCRRRIFHLNKLKREFVGWLNRDGRPHLHPQSRLHVNTMFLQFFCIWMLEEISFFSRIGFSTIAHTISIDITYMRHVSSLSLAHKPIFHFPHDVDDGNEEKELYESEKKGLLFRFCCCSTLISSFLLLLPRTHRQYLHHSTGLKCWSESLNLWIHASHREKRK